MKLLIAEDDAFFRRLLQQVLARDYELVLAEDGLAAWDALQEPDGPRLAILDWVMPGMSGPQVCREVRKRGSPAAYYLIILTAKNSSADVLSGLRAGADDYVTKPFDPEELRARVRLGQHIIQLENALQAQASALDDARQRERNLLALLPVCPRCHRVRADGTYWLEVEKYFDQHPAVHDDVVSCPVCVTLPKTSAAETGAPHQAVQ